MILKSNPTSTSQNCLISSPLFCPCNKDLRVSLFSNNFPLKRRNGRNCGWNLISSRRNGIIFKGCISGGGGGGGGGGSHHSLRARDVSSSARVIVLKRFSEDPELEESSANSSSRDFISSSSHNNNSFVGFEEDPIVDKLRTQLGVIHPLPSPRINRNIVGLFVFFFFVGVVFDKLWTSRKRSNSDPGRNEGKFGGLWRSQVQIPASLSTFLEKDLQRKESVEWVNMVLGKLWKVYRGGLENWIIGLLQPVIDNLKKPDYVERVEIKQFCLGDEPLSVRSVERKTSRRANDLQYQIGLRYTGGARMLLLLSLKFGLLPIAVPVGVRDFDIDGELWVKLRLIPSVPWVGAVSWAFVSLPKIKVELSPFRLFNLMTIPVLSMFLKKLLTEDLPKLFVRPKKIVLDFEKGKAVGPVPNETKPGEVQEGNKDFTGELSVTLVDARKLSYFYGKTDPYVILFLGDQVIRSKKNSQTTVIGPPGAPIWNQDFHLLVENPRKQKLFIEVKDSLGFTEFTVGTAEIDLGSLEDTIPADRIVSLRGGWTQFGRGSAGELLLRLTYKAYVEDEEDERSEPNSPDRDASDDELDAAYEQNGVDSSSTSDQESFMDVLAALIVSEEFLGIVASEAGVTKPLNNSKNGSDPRLAGTTIGSMRQAPESNSENSDSGSGNFRGSALLWLAVVTSVSVLIAMNMGGSSIFNP